MALLSVSWTFPDNQPCQSLGSRGAWVFAGDTPAPPICCKPEVAPTAMLRPCICHGAPAWGGGLWSGALLTPLSLSPLAPGEGLLEPGGSHRGPTLPVRGDTHHGGGHSLDLPAGRLQPASTPAFPWGPLLLP